MVESWRASSGCGPILSRSWTRDSATATTASTHYPRSPDYRSTSSSNMRLVALMFAGALDVDVRDLLHRTALGSSARSDDDDARDGTRELAIFINIRGHNKSWVNACDSLPAALEPIVRGLRNGIAVHLEYLSDTRDYALAIDEALRPLGVKVLHHEDLAVGDVLAKILECDVAVATVGSGLVAAQRGSLAFRPLCMAATPSGSTLMVELGLAGMFGREAPSNLGGRYPPVGGSCLWEL